MLYEIDDLKQVFEDHFPTSSEVDIWFEDGKIDDFVVDRNKIELGSFENENDVYTHVEECILKTHIVKDFLSIVGYCKIFFNESESTFGE